MDKKYNSSKIDGVSCDAKHCIYNREGNICDAGRIAIGTNNATSSSETICATFKCKSDR
ncbi:MAG: DUF1540 domain-containing protein [Clostridia bacterium]|nr:DUF1540 domain-containing protein [Clostridia bacterium]